VQTLRRAHSYNKQASHCIDAMRLLYSVHEVSVQFTTFCHATRCTDMNNALIILQTFQLQAIEVEKLAKMAELLRQVEETDRVIEVLQTEPTSAQAHMVSRKKIVPHRS
jgi:hypothetical protein